MRVPSSMTRSSQKLEMTRARPATDQQRAVEYYSAVKRNRVLRTCCPMHTGGHQRERRQARRLRGVGFHLWEVFRVGQVLEAEQIGSCRRVGNAIQCIWSFLFRWGKMGIEGVGDGCTALRVHSKPSNCVF